MLKNKLRVRCDLFDLSNAWMTSKSFQNSEFYAGIFNDFVIFTKQLLKISAIFVSPDVTPLLVLREKLCFKWKPFLRKIFWLHYLF